MEHRELCSKINGMNPTYKKGTEGLPFKLLNAVTVEDVLELQRRGQQLENFVSLLCEEYGVNYIAGNLPATYAMLREAIWDRMRC